MNQTVKLIAISAGALVMLTAANVAAKSIYTNSKLGLDWKVFGVALGVGVAVGYVTMKYFKS